MLSVLAATVLMASSASAQKSTTKAATGTSEKASESSSASGERKDPEGQTGVSPYVESLVKGHAAYAAKDFSKAIEIYQEAASKQPDKPSAFYYLGAAQLATNKLDDADKSWQSARKLVGNDNALHAKVLFVIADLRERQGKLEDATSAWKDYGAFVAAHPELKGNAATATEREKVLETRRDMVAKYTKVKERIAQRMEESATKGSK